MTKLDHPIVVRAKSLRADMYWKLSAIAPALGALTFHADDAIPTACVSPTGKVLLGPAFMGALPDPEFRFVLLHEAFHPMLDHQGRRGDRPARLWNIACDLAINSVLAQLKPDDGSGGAYIQVPASALLPSRHLPGAPELASAEEYYAWLTQHADQRKACEEAGEDAGGGEGEGQGSAEGDADGKGKGKGQGKSGKGRIAPGSGCGAEGDEQTGQGQSSGADGRGGDAQGDGDGGAGDQGDDDAGPGMSPEQWRLVGQVVVEQCSKSAGNAALGALAKLLQIPPPRVRWGDVLRRAATQAVAQAGRDDVAWSRRSRRSNALYTLPGGITTRACIAVVIDASGSVSDDALSRAVSETAAAVEATQVPAYLVIHDAAVQFEGWIHPGIKGRQVASYVRGRGGTLFSPAYDAIAENTRGKRFGALVHFTDGMPCEPWPDLPSNCRRGVAALIGYARKDQIPKRRWSAVACDLR